MNLGCSPQRVSKCFAHTKVKSTLILWASHSISSASPKPWYLGFMVISKGMSIKLPHFICGKFPFTKWERSREELWASLVQGPEGPRGPLSSLQKCHATSRQMSWCDPSRGKVTPTNNTVAKSPPIFFLTEKNKQPDYLPHLSLLQANAGSEGCTLPAEALLHEWAMRQGSACSCGHTNTRIKTCIVIAGNKLSKGNSQLCRDGLS